MARVRAQKGAVRILVGVLLGAQEEHVLEEVREALHFLGVRVRADLDVHGRGGLVGLGVGDQQHAKRVGHLHIAIRAVVLLGRLDDDSHMEVS